MSMPASTDHGSCRCEVSKQQRLDARHINLPVQHPGYMRVRWALPDSWRCVGAFCACMGHASGRGFPASAQSVFFIQLWYMYPVCRETGRASARSSSHNSHRAFLAYNKLGRYALCAHIQARLSEGAFSSNAPRFIDSTWSATGNALEEALMISLFYTFLMLCACECCTGCFATLLSLRGQTYPAAQEGVSQGCVHRAGEAAVRAERLSE